MKIIDQTPFFKENGEISFMDRGRAIMKYGPGWIKEIESQRPIIAAFDKILDKKYTLLRNITPPGLGAMIPFILVGPTGVYVMSILASPGMFSARGDQWSIISGGTLRPITPNLLTRTERMARAIQVFLHRQGYTDLFGVEAILLCSDPAINIDTIRPIIRVVMRDALERFAVSITQARPSLNPESVFDVVNRILNPPAVPSQVQPATSNPSAGVSQVSKPASIQASAETPTPAPSAVPAFQFDEEITPPPSAEETDLPAWLTPTADTPSSAPVGNPATGPVLPRRKGMSTKQWVLLAGMIIIWCVLVGVFLFLVIKDQGLLSIAH
jgi:hypothetical protein